MRTLINAIRLCILKGWPNDNPLPINRDSQTEMVAKKGISPRLVNTGLAKKTEIIGMLIQHPWAIHKITQKPICKTIPKHFLISGLRLQ